MDIPQFVNDPMCSIVAGRSSAAHAAGAPDLLSQYLRLIPGNSFNIPKLH